MTSDSLPREKERERQHVDETSAFFFVSPRLSACLSVGRRRRVGDGLQVSMARRWGLGAWIYG